MRQMGERIVGVVLACVGILALGLAFAGGAVHAAPGVDQAVSGSLVQEESSSPEESENGNEDSTDEDTTDEDVTDEDTTDEDATDEDATDEEETDSPTPSPLPTDTPTFDDTPTGLPTEDASASTGDTSALGWILLGGGVLMAGAAYAVYRRGL